MLLPHESPGGDGKLTSSNVTFYTFYTDAACTTLAPASWPVQPSYSCFAKGTAAGTGVITATYTSQDILSESVTPPSFQRTFSDTAIATVVDVIFPSLTPEAICADGLSTALATASVTPTGRPLTWTLMTPGLGATIAAGGPSPFTTALVKAGTTGGTVIVKVADATLSCASATKELTIIKVDLLVNNTEAGTDDVVVRQITSGDRRTGSKNGSGYSRNILLGGIGVQGPSDNHIPMKIRLQGPAGFNAKVMLTDTSPTGGGDISIKKSDGSAYPVAGELVTVGTDLEVHVFGATASAQLNDVTIKATTDKTGTLVCGNEDLTVLFASMQFRNTQDASRSAGNARTFPVPRSGQDKLGLQSANLTSTTDAWISGNMEIVVTVQPGNVVIPGVTWDIKREKERREWIDGVSRHAAPIAYSTTASKADDDGSDSLDEDLVQAVGDLKLYVIDAPALHLMSAETKHTKILNFREWVEVRIPRDGETVANACWFVVSNYEFWKILLKAKNSGTATNPNWAREAHSGRTSKPSVDNEVESGNYSEAVNTWTED